MDGVELVLDTNVVSIAETIVRKGYRSDEIQQVRAKHLYEWICARQKVEVNAALGCIEGANFDGFDLSAFGLLRRSSAVRALFGTAPRHREINPFDGRPLLDFLRLRDDGWLEAAVADAHVQYGAVVLPNYVAILIWHTVRADSKFDDNAARVIEVHRRCVEVMNYVPFAWSMLLYAELGTIEVARTVRDGLLKAARADVLRSARSGAWDIGFLAQMSMLRLADSSDQDRDTIPLLVTDDDQFARAARLIPAIGDSGRYELAATNFADPPAALSLIDGLLEMRSEAAPTIPRWEALVGAATELEEALEFPDRARLMTDRPIVELAPNGERMVRVVDLLRLRPEEVLPLVEDGPGQLYASLFVARYLLDELDGDLDVALVGALRRLAPAVIADPTQPGTAPFWAAVGLIHAWDGVNHARVNAYLEALEINFQPRMVKFLVIRLCRELLKAVGERLGSTEAEVASGLKAAFAGYESREPAIRYERTF